MKLAVTGHRPNTISSELYNVNSELSKRYIAFFKEYILNSGATECISGMALGVDTLFAIATLQLQNEHSGIKLICALPCLNQSCKWPPSSVKIYNAILKRADEIVFVTNLEYTHDCMQKRNIYMVDWCDSLLAIWNGKYSGTGNCVNYAKSRHTNIDIVSPTQIQIEGD